MVLHSVGHRLGGEVVMICMEVFASSKTDKSSRTHWTICLRNCEGNLDKVSEQG
ncbi:hypothetical protein M3J09_004590 [Ascochyta lentis]